MAQGHVYVSAVFAADNISCTSYPMENTASDHFSNVFMGEKNNDL